MIGEVVMPNDVLPADKHKFAAAYGAYVEKITSALEALNTHGEDSAQFAEADKRAGEAQKALSAIRGYKGGHWRS